jgi:putative ABC transport system permease protein
LEGIVILRAAARSLLRRPSFLLAGAATLALGIGAATALFTTVNTALLRPLPYPHGEDIYTVRTYFPSGRFTIGLVSPEELDSLGRLDGVIGMAGARRSDTSIVTDVSARQVTAFGVSGTFFDLFGVPMAMGRAIKSDDAAREAPRVVVLSHALWTSVYGARPEVVGSTINLGDRSAQVVGVARADFDMPAGADVWFNMWVPPHTIGHFYVGYARLKPGLEVSSLRAPIAQVMSSLGQKYPDQNKGRDVAFRPLLDAVVGDLRSILVVLFGAAGLLLLLAAANVTNLVLARSTTRVREIALLGALGASRRRVVFQLILESVLLSALGGLAGVAAAAVGLRLLISFGGWRLPRLDVPPFDPRVTGFALTVVLVAGLGIGLVTALRTIGGNPVSGLSEGSRGVRTSRTTRRLLGVFVVAEIAVAVALVTGAGRLVQSYQRLATLDPGFDPSGRLVLNVLLPPSYGTEARWNAWWQETETRLRDAGYAQIASASSLPLQHEWDSTTFVDILSRPDVPPDQRPNARLRVVSPDFFSTMGIRLLAGRPFATADGPGTVPVAIVNATFVRRSLGSADPLRERIKGFKSRLVDGRIVEDEVAIIGVAADVKYASLFSDPEPVVYVPASQSPRLRDSIVLTTADGRPEPHAAQFIAAVRSVDPKVAVSADSMAAFVSASLERQRLGMWVMVGFGAAAFLLAMVGVFGVVAYVVSERKGEMAIRLALGATRAQVFWSVLRDGAQLAIAGVLLGLIAAWWTGRLMGQYVYDVRAAEPVVLCGSAAIVGAAAIIATFVPASRASAIKPAQALQLE